MCSVLVYSRTNIWVNERHAKVVTECIVTDDLHYANEFLNRTTMQTNCRKKEGDKDGERPQWALSTEQWAVSSILTHSRRKLSHTCLLVASRDQCTKATLASSLTHVEHLFGAIKVRLKCTLKLQPVETSTMNANYNNGRWRRRRRNNKNYETKLKTETKIIIIEGTTSRERERSAHTPHTLKHSKLKEVNDNEKKTHEEAELMRACKRLNETNDKQQMGWERHRLCVCSISVCGWGRENGREREGERGVGRGRGGKRGDEQNRRNGKNRVVWAIYSAMFRL